ncbi:hypothetical protein LOAG_18734 [Loa loa]|uniref:Uncharacterized protein n=1 Tax=Loa loa TaxID=7209 RepID=A0A1S0UG90_LOALO|nr:hypothetical protein LOAG_18734 [Loa loa]EJD73877.1 hypothetical protein LOAG_18734 [Loa loa]
MDADRETNKIFIFGLCILIAWMIIIIICASPKLFRDILCRLCFCSIARRHEGKSRMMHCESYLQLRHVIAIEPSNIMLTQAFGNKFPLLTTKSIEKESHLAPIVQPEDSEICFSTDKDSITTITDAVISTELLQ